MRCVTLPGQDGWRIIWVPLAQISYQFFKHSAGGFEQDSDFLCAGHLVVPFEHGFDTGDDIRAGDQLLDEQFASDAARGVGVGEGAPDERGSRLVHAGMRIWRATPSLCIAHAVATTSSAPVNWCAAATHSDTSVITVAMPKSTMTPKAL